MYFLIFLPLIILSVFISLVLTVFISLVIRKASLREKTNSRVLDLGGGLIFLYFDFLVSLIVFSLLILPTFFIGGWVWGLICLYHSFLNLFLLETMRSRKAYFPLISIMILSFQILLGLSVLLIEESPLMFAVGGLTYCVKLVFNEIGFYPSYFYLFLLFIKNSVFIHYLLRSERVRRTFIY
jgi:hypothetical protein